MPLPEIRQSDLNSSATTSNRMIEHDSEYSLQNAITDAQWFAVTLTSDRNFGHRVRDENQLTETFYNAIINYKNIKDGTRNNRNKCISDLMEALLTKLALELKTRGIPPSSYKFLTAEQALDHVKSMHINNSDHTIKASSIDYLPHAQDVADLNTTVDSNAGMALVYKLIIIIVSVLKAEESLGEKNVERSSFVDTMLQNLTLILFNRPLLKTEKKDSKKLITEILEVLLRYAYAFTQYTDVRIVSTFDEHKVLVKSLVSLVKYIVNNQTNGSHHVEKSDIARAVILKLCENESANHFVNLFALIAQGIQLSRQMGVGGDDSRELEKVLKKIRDYLVLKLL